MILVHGFPDTSATWEPVARLLSTRFHVVAYDVRGAGGSDAPKRRADYALALLVEDMAAVIDAVSPDEPIHLVAHDWGSIQGWEAVTSDLLTGRIASYTSISGPPLDHAALWARRHRAGNGADVARALRQALRSWYIAFFHFPYLPEIVTQVARARRLAAGTDATARDHRRGHPHLRRGATTSHTDLSSTAPMCSDVFATRWRAIPRRRYRSSSRSGTGTSRRNSWTVSRHGRPWCGGATWMLVTGSSAPTRPRSPSGCDRSSRSSTTAMKRTSWLEHAWFLRVRRREDSLKGGCPGRRKGGFNAPNQFARRVGAQLHGDPGARAPGGIDEVDVERVVEWGVERVVEVDRGRGDREPAIGSFGASRQSRRAPSRRST